MKEMQVARREMCFVAFTAPCCLICAVLLCFSGVKRQAQPMALVLALQHEQQPLQQLRYVQQKRHDLGKTRYYWPQPRYKGMATTRDTA